MSSVGRVKSAKLLTHLGWLLGQYRFGDSASVRPYVGAGAVYFMVMESKDGSLASFDAESRWGSVAIWRFVFARVSRALLLVFLTNCCAVGVNG